MQTNLDKIRIEDLEVFCNHGVFPEETKLGQKFLASCTLYLDTRKAGCTDDLEESINYGTISHLIKKQMEEKTCKLIEAVAEHLAETVLMYDEKIRQVDIKIKKPWAPIGLPLKTASVEVSRKWHEVYISFGSNIGDKRAYMDSAVNGIEQTPGCRIKKVSEYLVTKPYGMVEQDEFLNGAIKLETLLTPHELLDRLHELEQAAKRERIIHWGPRTLDLDMLLYDDLVLEDDDLCIPHVDMHNRYFVLKPMSEIAPYKRHPVYGKTIREMLAELPEMQE